MPNTRVTAQSQTSVPALVRRELGIRAGTTLEWTVADGKATVTKRAGVSFGEMNKRLFPDGPPKPATLTKNEMLDLHFRMSTKFNPPKQRARG
jgi:bifunctional DNA-binding transcriptional regulator/antitoxin component of YhaV-PrlF toxin-antitoxin module